MINCARAWTGSPPGVGCALARRPQPVGQRTGIVARRWRLTMPRSPRPIRAWRLPEQGAPSTGQAAAVEAALNQDLILHLGALPLLLPLLDRLGLRDVVNQRCHPTGTVPEDLDLGLVTGVLVLNRLLAPTPLVHVETWL